MILPDHLILSNFITFMALDIFCALQVVRFYKWNFTWVTFKISTIFIVHIAVQFKRSKTFFTFFAFSFFASSDVYFPHLKCTWVTCKFRISLFAMWMFNSKWVKRIFLTFKAFQTLVVSLKTSMFVHVMLTLVTFKIFFFSVAVQH